MENFKEIPEIKIENDELEKNREELEQLMKENIAKKEKGENYDAHFDRLNPKELGKEELVLWDKLRKVKTREDWEILYRDFDLYKQKVEKEVIQELAQKGLESGDDEFYKSFQDHYKINFSGFFGNKLGEKQKPFLMEDLKKLKEQRFRK